MKSVLVTYLLWLFGGVFGLHHFYLRRDRQAFLWWSTLGGSVFGWLCEFFSLSRYVREANEDPTYIRSFIGEVRRNERPPFSSSRFSRAVLAAFFWGQLFKIAIPEQEFGGIDWSFLNWFAAVPVALGVWNVGNEGREKGTIWWALISAFACAPLKYWIYDDSTVFLIMVTASAFAFDTFSKRWRREPLKKRKFCKRVFILGACAVLYLSLWGGYVYFNGMITDSEGNEVPVHEAFQYFFTSPWWVDLQQSLYDTYLFAQHNGWYEIWKQIIELSDPHGELNAYKVLQLDSGASQHDITAAWRRLSKEYHPDKAKDEAQRNEAQDKFLEVQTAYDILSKQKHRRNKMNKKDNTEL